MLSDQDFIDSLRESQGAVDATQQLLLSQGETIVRPAMNIRPSFKDRKNYSDDGDLFIQRRIEIKKRSFSFSGADDFPYDSVFVDSADRVDSSRVWRYYIWSDDLKSFLIVPSNTKEKWKRRTVYNKRHGENRTYYVAPLACCYFYTFLPFNY